MVWAADTEVTVDELRSVAEETGVGEEGFMAFAAFVAEKCAAVADRAQARGERDAGDQIRAAFARCWPEGSGAVQQHHGRVMA